MKQKKKKSDKLCCFFLFLYKALNLHFIIAQLWPTFSSDQCDDCFPQHNTDTGGADHSCSICGKSLSSASSLDRHMLVHSGERPYKCTVCGQSFTTNGNMHRWVRAAFASGGWQKVKWPLSHQGTCLQALRICALHGEVGEMCSFSPVYGTCLAMGNRSTWARSLAFGDPRDETQSPSPSANWSFFVWVPEVGSLSDTEEPSRNSTVTLAS